MRISNRKGCHGKAFDLRIDGLGQGRRSPLGIIVRAWEAVVEGICGVQIAADHSGSSSANEMVFGRIGRNGGVLQKGSPVFKRPIGVGRNEYHSDGWVWMNLEKFPWWIDKLGFGVLRKRGPARRGHRARAVARHRLRARCGSSQAPSSLRLVTGSEPAPFLLVKYRWCDRG
jgi:hypothetical protein